MQDRQEVLVLAEIPMLMVGQEILVDTHRQKDLPVVVVHLLMKELSEVVAVVLLKLVEKGQVMVVMVNQILIEVRVLNFMLVVVVAEHGDIHKQVMFLAEKVVQVVEVMAVVIIMEYGADLEIRAQQTLVEAVAQDSRLVLTLTHPEVVLE
jgi:hypothetical protein